MMINGRLIGMVSESKKYIAANVTLQWSAPAAGAGQGISARCVQRIE